MKLIGCSGGYHPEDMVQHKQYIAHDMKQRQVQHRALPEDYPTLLPQVILPVKPARDGAESDLAKRSKEIVKVSVVAPATKPSDILYIGAAKSVLAMDPQGEKVTVEVGPTVYAPTLSLSDAPEKAGRSYPCGACLPTPLWCLQVLITRGLSS